MKDRAVPPECAIKVYKTSLNEFKRREEYMRGDHRLPSQGYKKHNPRKVKCIINCKPRFFFFVETIC